MRLAPTGMTARNRPGGYRQRYALRIRACWCLCLWLQLLVFPTLGQTVQDRPPTGKKGDQPSIYKVFDHEMKQHRSATTDTLKVPVWSALPAWLTAEIAETPGTLLMPGISDPGLPSTLAYRQALTRALSMAMLARGCTGSYISDLYAESAGPQSSSRFEEIYNFTTRSLQPLKTSIVYDTVLASGEVAVLAAVEVKEGMEKGERGDTTHAQSEDTAGTVDPLMTVSAFLYNYEFTNNGGGNWLRKSEIVSKSAGGDSASLSSDSLAFYQIDRRFTAATNLQKTTGRDFGHREYYYGMPANAFRPANPVKDPADSVNARSNLQIIGDSTDDAPGTAGILSEVRGTSCEWGLWLAFTDQVMDALAFYLKKNTVETRTVTDQTTVVNHGLNREMQRLSLRYAVRQVSLSENRLKVLLNITQ